MTTAMMPAEPFPQTADRTAELMAAVEPGFLQLMQRDDAVRVLTFPVDHLLLGGQRCLVIRCHQLVTSKTAQGLCRGCARRMELKGETLEEFLAEVKTWRSIGVTPCSVEDCGRARKTYRTALCSAHAYQQQKMLRLPLEEFLRHPDVRPLPSFGPCLAASCPRDRDGATHSYCKAHQQRRLYELRRGSTLDEETWRLTTAAISESGTVSLRGLHDQVVAEVLYGMQQCNKAGVRQRDYLMRPLCDVARARQVRSLAELDRDTLTASSARWAGNFLKHAELLGLSPETERHKDIWKGVVFGLPGGHLYFDKIHQPWLRQAAKDWAAEDVPRRRGGNSTRSVVQERINAIARMSDSLRINRADHGMDLHVLGRDDILTLLTRLLFLQEQGEISARKRGKIVRDLRRVLNSMRSLGMTRPNRTLHGLADDFVIREEDIPDDPEDEEAGKDLPPEVMRQLCEHLDALGAGDTPEARTITELLMDTGRRPDEACQLPYDCLDRAEDGTPVLVYDNRKALRLGRRLPIAQATASLIIQQQTRVRTRFPDTPVKDLSLFPSPVTNPDGSKPISVGWVSTLHRNWVDSLPDLLVPIVVEEDGERVTRMLPFDKAKIFLYAYRHSYAQRHADAGVQPDVLQGLMDHRQLSTTQRYYRVSEQRKREAVDRVSALQFDRHGNRIWRQAKELLDDEYARRAVGEVQAPYGVCVEPSNVAAGGHACPVRFRCVGCDHFRTDASYLPDLEAYLADLLRNRERLAAFTTADDWAKAEAMPSDQEITRVRRLIRRVREDLDALTAEDRAQIEEATTILPRSRRQTVSLGMPRVGPPMPDFHPGTTA
ncbi:site-specific integrase [Streptomyces sp. NBC_00378]|uniref:tyrosine-type recombinase/integrase n=1 Tax=Streptomyces sp. NBC_00378 TaxID=2975732 RepID=UPI00224FA530|nr:site-specific integrase [Streptomyces sp. NBC_00378]MCX5115247.1 site-specific integrase [Streptomyces sp. NBC_00378]